MDIDVTDALARCESVVGDSAGPARAMLRAFALLQTTLNSQAQLWAYVDVFRDLAIVCAVGVPLAFVMKKARSEVGAA